MQVLVTGGTGTLGRQVVRRLHDTGCGIRVLSRHSPSEYAPDVQYVIGDLSTNAGTDAAVRQIDVIVHCAGSSTGDDIKTGHLVRAANSAGVRHLVFISVVGADRVPIASRLDRTLFGYFGSKRAAEQVVVNGGIPWTTLRATQFHEIVLLVAHGLSKLPVVPVPSGFRFQPVAAGEVAERLVELALGEPRGLVPDIGGPRSYAMADLVRSYLRARNLHRLLVPLPLPGNAARAIRNGANLPRDGIVGACSWEAFLQDHVG